MGRNIRMEADEQKVSRAAYHEAGHAIIGHLQTRGIKSMCIDTTWMPYDIHGYMPEGNTSYINPSKGTDEEKLILLMAGKAAEEIATGAHIPEYSHDDGRKASQIIWSAQERGKEIIGLEEAKDRAEAILRQDSNWQAVQEIKSALLNQEEINGIRELDKEKIAKILEAALR